MPKVKCPPRNRSRSRSRIQIDGRRREVASGSFARSSRTTRNTFWNGVPSGCGSSWRKSALIRRSRSWSSHGSRSLNCEPPSLSTAAPPAAESGVGSAEGSVGATHPVVETVVPFEMIESDLWPSIRWVDWRSHLVVSRCPGWARSPIHWTVIHPVVIPQWLSWAAGSLFVGLREVSRSDIADGMIVEIRSLGL